jgi:uncharacterized protein YbjT (DUF2867 family)
MTGRVFLIGATGNVGKALLRELAPDQASGRLDVAVGTRSETAATLVRGAGMRPVPFDFENLAGFDTAFAGAGTLFMLRPYTIRQMMYGKQVIDAAVRTGINAVVTVGAYGAADTPWPVIGWNFLVESYAERSGLAWTHLRPNFFMDNILAQRDPASGTIHNGLVRRVSWIASEDIAAVAAAVLRDPAKHAGRAYALASEAASPDDIAADLAAATGQPHRVVPPDRAIVMKRLLAQGREPFYADALLEYVAAIAAGDVPEAADVFDTVELVAGRPALKWREFLARRLR